jgi:hypothetical protein
MNLKKGKVLCPVKVGYVQFSIILIPRFSRTRQLNHHCRNTDILLALDFHQL